MTNQQIAEEYAELAYRVRKDRELRRLMLGQMFHFKRLAESEREMSTLMAKVRDGSNGWELRHNSAVGKASLRRRFETPILGMLEHWQMYARQYKTRYEDVIASDGFLGPKWVQIGQGIRALFDGELGRLSGGILDEFYCEVLEENGFTDEGDVA